MTDSYYAITEIAGDQVSREQVERLTHRYLWAGTFVSGKDVVEAGCGSGPGLTYLASVAGSLEAGDYSQQMVDICRERLGGSLSLQQFDAQQMPFEDQSKDVILLFEALYYVPSPERFFAECRRVLRPGGRILIATANKDLYDFNPSPNSYRYLGTAELAQICAQHGMRAELFGHVATNTMSMRQRLLRPIKKMAVAMGVVPKTNEGKKWLKRLVFGRLVPLPADIDPGAYRYTPPTAVSPNEPDRIHKVIYCCATLPT